MQKKEKPRFTAVIADDHQIVRSGLRAAISEPGLVEEGGIEVVAEASNGLEAIELVKTKRPDLLLLDVQMPYASGAEILNDIKRWSPDTKIVVLTAVTSPGLLSGLVEAGVDGLFSKASDNEEFLAKLPVILRGGRHVEDAIAELIKDSVVMPDLTQRERQSLNMIIAGKTNSEIAVMMGISPKTAEKHRGSLMAKLGVKSVVELISKALEDGLIETTTPVAKQPTEPCRSGPV
jgi:DNA-binding NarL/FixJ family response regulator